MFHPAHPAPVRNGLVKGVACRSRSERFPIARAETLDRLLVEQRLGRRHEREGLGSVGRALVGGVKTTKALDLIAEKVEAECHGFAGGEKVDERAPYGIFAMLG